VRETDLIEITREGRVKELSFLHVLPFVYTQGYVMTQRKGVFNHAGAREIGMFDFGAQSFAITICSIRF
jgi:hypothetical protein